MQKFLLLFFFIPIISLSQNVIWENIYYTGDTLSKISGNQVIECSDNNYLICGNYSFNESPTLSSFLMKYSKNGDRLWDNKIAKISPRYNKLNILYTLYLSEEKNGYVFCGVYPNYWNNFGDQLDELLYVLNTDTSGKAQYDYIDSLSSRTYTMNNGIIKKDTNNAFIRFNYSNIDILLSRYSADGHLLKENLLYKITDYKDTALTLIDVIVLNNDYYLIGYFSSSNSNDPDRYTHNFIAKVNSNDSLEWINFPAYDFYEFSIKGVKVNDSTFGILGTESSGSTKKLVFREYDTLGKLVFEKKRDITNMEVLVSIKKTYDNGYIVAGEQKIKTDSLSFNFYLLKFDSAFNLLWEKSWHRSDYGDYNGIIDVIQTSDSNYIVTGQVIYSLYTAKISNPTNGIQEFPQINSKQTIVCPNPVQDILTISNLLNDFNYNTNIEIYNIYGLKEIEIPYTDKIDVSKLNVGVYYLKINNQFTKFVKI